MNPKYTELSYDVVLPSHLLVNPNLEPQAKMLYGLVRNLTKLEGYCFSRNLHLANLMKVQVRTISRWLDSLEKEGYIERFHDSDEFKSVRKIFISDKFKNVIRKDKNVPPPRQKCPRGRTKMSYSKEDIGKGIYENNNTEPPEPEEAVVVFSKKAFEKASKKCEIDQDKIDRAWKIWEGKSDLDKAKIPNPIGWLIECARKEYQVPEQIKDENRCFLTRCENAAIVNRKEYLIQTNLREGYLIFTDCPSKVYRIEDRDFVKKVGNQMSLRNLWKL